MSNIHMGFRWKCTQPRISKWANQLHPGKLTAGTKKNGGLNKWFSFSIGWFLGSMVIFCGAIDVPLKVHSSWQLSTAKPVVSAESMTHWPTSDGTPVTPIKHHTFTYTRTGEKQTKTHKGKGDKKGDKSLTSKPSSSGVLSNIRPQPEVKSPSQRSRLGESGGWGGKIPRVQASDKKGITRKDKALKSKHQMIWWKFHYPFPYFIKSIPKQWQWHPVTPPSPCQAQCNSSISSHGYAPGYAGQEPPKRVVLGGRH